MKRVSILFSLSLSFVTVGSFAGNFPFKSCLEPSGSSYRLMDEMRSSMPEAEKLEELAQKYTNLEGQKEENNNTIKKDRKCLNKIKEYYESCIAMDNLQEMGLSSPVPSKEAEKRMMQISKILELIEKQEERYSPTRIKKSNLKLHHKDEDQG